jgi:hypothetical protein
MQVRTPVHEWEEKCPTAAQSGVTDFAPFRRRPLALVRSTKPPSEPTRFHLAIRNLYKFLGLGIPTLACGGIKPIPESTELYDAPELLVLKLF